MGELLKELLSAPLEVYCGRTADTGYENVRVWQVLGTETFWNPPGPPLTPEPEPVRGPVRFKSIRK